MEPLYTAETVFDYDLIKDINFTMQRKRFFIFMTMMGVIWIVISMNGNILKALICTVVFIMIYAGLYYALIMYIVKKTWKSRQNLDNVAKYKFYEDKFEAQSENAAFNLEYSKLYKLTITEKYILLFITSSQVYALRKKDCSDELIAFLESKKK